MHNANIIIIVLCTCLCINAIDLYNEHRWQGNWFPVDPGYPDLNNVVNPSELEKLQPNPVDLHDAKHGVKMGVSSSNCDDGKTNLTVDWNGSPEAYTCFEPRTFTLNLNTHAIEQCDYIPASYWAMHACMNESIEYNDPIPTFGAHRPLWPKYGEYRYVPKQRWLHSMEHGAIVMLYHPCADIRQVFKLKRIVKNCLYRHIITPCPDLTPERPLALLTWGCRLTMNVVDSEIVTEFIKEHALKGPESVSRDGQFSDALIHPAEYVTDRSDRELCPAWLIRRKRKNRSKH